MPVQTTYPGVYVEEIPSGVRTITGVSTSIAAFIGRAKKGPPDSITILNYGDYERNFGGLWELSPMSFAVRDFFLNGGSEAVIVRVHKGALTVKKALPHDGGTKNLKVEASSVGLWSKDMDIIIDYNTRKKDDGTDDTTLFNISLSSPDGITEKFLNLTIDPTKSNSIDKVLKQNSQILRVDELSDKRPKEGTYQLDSGGSDGKHIGENEIFSGSNMETDKKGLYALEKTDIFNILCIPPYTNGDDTMVEGEKATDVTTDLIAKASAYCKKRRAVLLVDPHSNWTSMGKVVTDVSDPSKYPASTTDYAALYFPRLLQSNPLMDNQIEEFVPCGSIAGILARTDTERGIWKAPAGTDSSILGIRGLSVSLTDQENGKLNPIGVNCLRGFPIYGNVTWEPERWPGPM